MNKTFLKLTIKNHTIIKSQKLKVTNSINSLTSPLPIPQSSPLSLSANDGFQFRR
jgi:hypothetical protein